MRDIEDLLRDGVETAFALQTEDGVAGAQDVKRRVIRRGRRRRAVRMGAAGLLSVALVAGAASAGGALLRRDTEIASRQVPDLGAERVFGSGPLATDGQSLWVGDGKLSNTEGDANSVARMDLATGEVVDGRPAIQVPQEMAWGETGIWTVAWEGDMPVGGEGHPVRGVIQRVDPVTLEKTGEIAREDSAPYDIAVGTVGGREVVWVVDNGRDELLEIDAETMELTGAHAMPRSPVAVHVQGGRVYVTSSKDHVVVRMDAESGETVEFPVPECANDVRVSAGSLWVADYCGGGLVRIDEETREVTSIAAGKGATSVEVAEGLVWVATQDGVVRVDPLTDAPVGNPVYVSDFLMGGLLYAGGDMWVYGFDGVYRLSEDVPPTTPTPAPPATEDPRDAPLPAGAQRISIPREARVLAAGAGSMWTGLFTVDRIDPASGDVLEKIDPGGFVEVLDYDEDAGVLWALVEVAEKETNAVVAIDPETNDVALGPVLLDPPGVYGQGMDAADGVAWVAGQNGLSGVDLATGRVTEIDISEHFGGPDDTSGFHVGVTHDSVFVASGSGTVVRVDPATGEHAKVDDLGWNVIDVESDGDTLWVLHDLEKMELWTLDGATGERIGEPAAIGRYGFAHLAHYEGTVWVAHAGGEGGKLELKAYTEGAGDPQQTIELPKQDFMTDAEAGPWGLWLTTGHDFLYRVVPD